MGQCQWSRNPACQRVDYHRLTRSSTALNSVLSTGIGTKAADEDRFFAHTAGDAKKPVSHQTSFCLYTLTLPVVRRESLGAGCLNSASRIS